MNLTRNFTLKEFASKDGAPTPLPVVHKLQQLAINLQALRDEIGKPIRINSGYRSPAHNRAVGGASRSRHVIGDAADIVVVGMPPAEVAATIERLISEGKMQQGGLKAYATFCHYDCRSVKARW
jgi:uncharacterized protein YcbK (DUF882 family)